MPVSLPQTVRQAACDAIVDLADAGAGAATIVIYDGAEPDVDSAASGTLLGTLTMSDPAFGAASTAGTATANAITDDSSADATSTATYFRVLDSDSTVVYQGDVGATGSGASLELNTVSITALSPISISALTLQVPEAQS